MTNVIICVASRSQERFQGFMEELSRCYFKGPHMVIVIGTGEPLTINPLNENYMNINPLIIQLENKDRWYGEVMLQKLNVLREYANIDSVIIMCDDDYSFNFHAVSIVRKIFNENSHVDYMSLLRGPGLNPPQEDIEVLSGFHFLKTRSCMGGSFICRWKTFLPIAEEFFEQYGTTHQFDSIFFDYLDYKEGTDKHVYTILDMSLMQHTNLISHYLLSKGPGGIRSHMYGEKYDPRCNPFKVLGIEEIRPDAMSGYIVSTCEGEDVN